MATVRAYGLPCLNQRARHQVFGPTVQQQEFFLNDEYCWQIFIRYMDPDREFGVERGFKASGCGVHGGLLASFGPDGALFSYVRNFPILSKNRCSTNWRSRMKIVIAPTIMLHIWGQCSSYMTDATEITLCQRSIGPPNRKKSLNV